MLKKEYLIYKLSEAAREACKIDNELFPMYNVKRGLRNEDGSGVLVGLTQVGNVVGYERLPEGGLKAIPGKLFYRGYDVEDLAHDFIKEKRFGFEEVAYLLLSGKLPDKEELSAFKELLNDNMPLEQKTKMNILDLEGQKLEVENGSTLSLGNHNLTFVFAPMVHWPEVMVTYDSTDKVLFSADGFGKFGALDVEEDWDFEARRYYIGIVGKYGAQVQKLLKAAATLDIQTICPLHGPILTENLGHYLEKYDIWSSYKVESEGVVIAYTSVYGNTKKAVELLAQKLEEKGCPKVTVFDLARDDMAEAVEDAFRYGKLVLATITYNGDIFPFMRTYIENLTERSYQNRTIGLIENGSWAPAAARIMQGMFEKSKNITWLENNVKITSSLSEANEAEIEAMAEELCK